MKILVATDFSQQAERAASTAAQLARRFGDTLVLAHVLEPPSANLFEISTDVHTFEKALREAVEKALAEQADGLRSHGVSVDTTILRGEAHEALCVYAKEVNARIIVLGSHGRRAPWRWFVGSVAERTQRTSDRPVLVVRNPADGIAEWAAGRRPLRVLVAIDMSSVSHAPVDWVQKLRKAGPCLITFIHASRPFAFQPASDVLALVDRELRNEIGELAHDGNVSVRIVPNWNTDAESIVHYADAEKMDLVIVGTHQRRGLDLVTTGSVAREVLRTASAPVLTVPTVELIERPLETPRLHSVVAATDLTEVGNRVVPYAYAITRPGGQVILCHVLVGARPSVLAATDKMAEERRALHDEVERRLRALVPADAHLRGISTHVAIREATDPAEGIIDVAERLGADAVCIGSRHRSEVTRALVGSVAERILRTPDLPLFVVRTHK